MLFSSSFFFSSFTARWINCVLCDTKNVCMCRCCYETRTRVIKKYRLCLYSRPTAHRMCSYNNNNHNSWWRTTYTERESVCMSENGQAFDFRALFPFPSFWCTVMGNDGTDRMNRTKKDTRKKTVASQEYLMKYTNFLSRNHTKTLIHTERERGRAKKKQTTGDTNKPKTRYRKTKQQNQINTRTHKWTEK